MRVLVESVAALLTFQLTKATTATLEYCSHDLESRHVIPALSAEDQLQITETRLTLTRLITLVRHGSRTPTRLAQCFPGYTPTLNWGCADDVVIAPRSLGQSQPSTLFSKSADPTPAGGTSGVCVLGQLLPEGLEQHRFNGRHLRKAYVGASATVSPLISDDEVLGDAEVFFRSTDLPRTVTSGQVLTSTFLGGHLDPQLTWHAPELSSDYLYANAAACPLLAVRQHELFTSEEFAAFDAKGRPARDAVSHALGGFPWDLDALEGPSLDCLMVNECSGTGLPLDPEVSVSRFFIWYFSFHRHLTWPMIDSGSLGGDRGCLWT